MAATSPTSGQGDGNKQVATSLVHHMIPIRSRSGASDESGADHIRGDRAGDGVAKLGNGPYGLGTSSARPMVG